MSAKTNKSVKQYKTATVTALKDKLAHAKAFFITDYRGLTHPQLETLRKALKKVKAEFVVAKNTLMRMALNSKQEIPHKLDPASGETKCNPPAGGQKDKLTEELNNPTATFFAFGDEMEAIKAFSAFMKNIQLPKIKIGFMGGNIATPADFQKLASLPGRDVLLATLAARLKSPIYGLHYALSWNMRKLVTVLENVKSKK